MKPVKTLIFGAALLASTSVMSVAAMAKDIVVGVSWSNFQEERWKTDEAAIKGALAPSGAKYISADAQGSPTKQLADVESLIKDTGFKPNTPIEVGVRHFVDWYRSYYRV